MFRLTREVRFALTDPDDPQLRQKPSNSFAGYPSLTGIRPYLALQVTLAGELEPQSSYLRNIKEIDDVVRQKVIARMEELAPGFASSILHRQVIGPHEMETRYALLGGNIFHGELSANQLFHMRPAPGYADFTTPIRGLYQASSATHGGGGVTGIPALQVVRKLKKVL